MNTRGHTARDQRDASPVETASSQQHLPSQTAGTERSAEARSVLPSSTPSSTRSATSWPAGSEDVSAGGSGRSKVAFAFQGGGSLAACQVGMVRALGEAGIVADLVVGSSAGALNAVAFATGPRSDLDSLEALWTALRRRHVAPLSARVLMRAVLGRADGLVSDDGLRAVINTYLPPRLEDTHLPAHVVVTDFSSGSPVVLSRGATGPALLASSAFPGLYPPVTIAGRRFVDGGVSADVPVLQAEDLGAAVTFVLPAAVSDDDTSPHGPLAMAYRALGQILDAAARNAVSAARGLVHVLPAPFSDASNPVDFRGTSRLIDDGYRLTTHWLAADAHLRPSPARERSDVTLVSSAR